ncbi:MAG TPA: 6,7-dimethyl-8-ribityllumazine synthase [Pirellulales bacterium]|nr:6,7-dimethyl-8-ribityllumazine synthase [Lacipirellulaceae bacterium]HVU88176.1 6,7-dimethyl-8-ribityllumazine synthase [Pirellulales bacterium]
MPQTFEGKTKATAAAIAIVVSRYNESVTGRLLTGALETLAKSGVPEKQVTVAWVPGAFEIPVVAARLADSERYAAVICLGAVIRGETTHDQHINRAVSLELAGLSVRTGIPVLFGLLTCDSLEQAIHRSGGNVGNKGSDCAEAALQMIDLISQLPR